MAVEQSELETELPEGEIELPTVELELPKVATEPWFFSETNWREIRESLAARGVDLDAVTLGRRRFVPGERWWLTDAPTVFPLTLRDALERMAHHYRILGFVPRWRGVTPLRQAQMLRKSLAALDKTLAALPVTEALIYPLTAEVYRAQRDSNDALRMALWRRMAELHGTIAKLTALGSRSAGSARTVHNDCWRDFAQLWRWLTPGAGKFRRKHLRSFLIACTKPVFPNIAARGLEQKVDSFISNFFKSG